MKLKKRVLSFLRKLVRDEISLMLDGNAFQARGPAMEKALSVKRSRVREMTKLPRTLDRSRLSSQHRTSLCMFDAMTMTLTPLSWHSTLSYTLWRWTCAKNEVSRSRLQRVKSQTGQTYTHREICYHAAVADGNMQHCKLQLLHYDDILTLCTT